MQKKKTGRPMIRKQGSKKPRVVGEIPHLDIVPDSVITQRRKNSRTNVEISGKKKRKIMKQLKRLQGGKKAKDVEMDDVSEAVTKKGKKKQPKVKDVEMDKEDSKEEEEDEDMDE